MKRFFIYTLFILLFVSCGERKKTPRDLEEEFKKSLNGKIFMDNSNNYYMIKYEKEVYYGNSITIFKITKVDKNDVKVFFK